tara:strand:+ start:1347 stop:1463 length:117 start_codon:yes stop_codon:yes gene_type:complete
MKYLVVSKIQSNQGTEGEMNAHLFGAVLMDLEKSNLLR